MEYSPKLKKAMQQIKAILEQNDIAGIILLHGPGFGEYLIHLDTSYSVATVGENEIRVRARLQEDFNGDKVLWEQKVKDTANMLSLFMEMGMTTIDPIINLSKLLEEKVEVTHTDISHTSNKTQNN